MTNSRFAFLARPSFWLVLVIVVAVISGGAYFYSNQSAAQTVSTLAVSRGDLKAEVSANGRVRATKSVKLAFPLSGLVAKVNVQEGDAVKAGDVLAELDPTDAQRRLQEARANLAARQEDLTEAKQPPAANDLEIAQQGLKKAALALAAAQARYKDNATDENRITQELAQSDYDIAQANFNRITQGPTQFTLDRLQRAIDAANFDLQTAQDALNDTKLTAPFDGIVTEVDATQGQLLGGYNPAVLLADTSKLELTADIDEIDVAAVNEGQNVEIRFDAFPGETAQGTVERLFPAASTDRGATIYEAISSLLPTDLKLRPGMGATVNIATIEKKGVLRVPNRAIKSAGTQKIVVVRDGNSTRNTVVQTGLSDGNETEILSGLAEGTIIVLQ
jgi:HlyD family secretion protein